MPIRFIYFDLGKVLVDFDPQQMARQMADVAGIGPEAVRDALLESGLQMAFERGELTSEGFHRAFCERIGAECPFEDLLYAGSAIFTPKVEIMPLVAELRRRDFPCGVLSNTCDAHWQYCCDQFPDLLAGFDVHALSYRIGSMKPEAEIYERAAELAGYPADAIFFVDDLEANVVGARAAGFDAVVFTSAARLAADLRARGVSLDSGL